MATREATDSGRKKLTTYGKTSRKSSKPVFSIGTASDHTQDVVQSRLKLSNRSNTTAVAGAAAESSDNIIRLLKNSQRPQGASPSSTPKSGGTKELSGTAPESAGTQKALHTTSETVAHARAPRATSRPADVPAMSGLVTQSASRTERAKEATNNRRVRLIDRLAAQVVERAEPDSEQSSQLSDSLEGSPGQALAVSDSHGATPKRSHDDTTRLGTQRSTPDSRKRKAKATYGHQRTMRTAVDAMGDSAGDVNSPYARAGDRNSSPPAKVMKMDSFSLYDEHMDDDVRPTKNGILSLHALRQAGANHRFADELSDLAERIGTPKSTHPISTRSRRTTILELGGKLQDEKFVGRLCDYGPKETFFQDFGAEGDTVNIIVLLSTVLVLVASSSAPQLINHLLSSGVAQILSTMLSLNKDITEIARQKAASLSKRGLASMDILRGAMLQLDVWDGSPPAVFSPKTLALKVLCVGHKSSNAEARQDLIEPLVPQLFALVANTDGESSMATMDTRAQVSMALLLLQDHSIGAMESKASDRWTEEYLPIAASFLSDMLTSSGEGFKEARYLTLRLAMNTTNNNSASASIFGQGHLARQLATASLSQLQELHASMERGVFPTDIHRTLVLLLGLLINISEHCPSTRRSLADEVDSRASPLDGLVAVWLENRESCGKAETVEQTSLAVAYGYLAILLGYLCLEPRVRQLLATQSNKKGLAHLLDSIQEFMTLHARAADDDLAATLQPLVNELRLLMNGRWE